MLLTEQVKGYEDLLGGHVDDLVRRPVALLRLVEAKDFGVEGTTHVALAGLWIMQEPARRNH